MNQLVEAFDIELETENFVRYIMYKDITPERYIEIKRIACKVFNDALVKYYKTPKYNIIIEKITNQCLNDGLLYSKNGHISKLCSDKQELFKLDSNLEKHEERLFKANLRFPSDKKFIEIRDRYNGDPVAIARYFGESNIRLVTWKIYELNEFSNVKAEECCIKVKEINFPRSAKLDEDRRKRNKWSQY